MANFITQSISSTYAGQEFTEILFAPQEGSSDLSGIRVIPNIKVKANMYLNSTLTKIVRKYSTCGFAATGGVTNVSDRTLEVSKLKVNLEECGDAFYGTIFDDIQRYIVQSCAICLIT